MLRNGEEIDEIGELAEAVRSDIVADLAHHRDVIVVAGIGPEYFRLAEFAQRALMNHPHQERGLAHPALSPHQHDRPRPVVLLDHAAKAAHLGFAIDEARQSLLQERSHGFGCFG